jgi:hypothetical protein
VRLLAVASLVILVIVGGLRMASPQLAPRVNVRWTPDLSTEQRAALERRFHLVSPAHVEGSTWTYDLSDPSPANVNALVDHPAVEDTHGIDRQAGLVEADAPQGTTWVDSSLLAAWSASAPIAWLGVLSLWATLLSWAWLGFNRRSARRETNPSTPASSRLPG